MNDFAEDDSRKRLRTIWITGAGGLIGNYLVQTAKHFAPDFKVVGLTRSDLDLLDFPSVRQRFHKEKPQAVIHCAAMSQSPACQKQPALARQVNVGVTALLAELSADIPFVFFSTDLVFDGRKGDYVETDEVNPLSIYAETKVAAEKIVMANPKHTIVRTSLNGGISPSGNRGFNEQLRNAFRSDETVTLFTDEFRSPIPASATTRAVWELIGKNLAGLFHIAGGEKLSRWQIGKLIAGRCLELNPKLKPESLVNYHGAPRSPDTSLNCAKVQAHLSFALPGLSEWLSHCPEPAF
ncbi:MAG TPA: SDR family oxidoreductase [Verrucomicrobiae bacterium]|nr:SDR family oxidoreductase [Verrucomicrobiae bacterium]